MAAASLVSRCPPGAKPLIPIDITMFAEQRRRLNASLTSALKRPVTALIQGGSEIPRDATDTGYLFRQESYFYYLFGHEDPDCFGAVESPSGYSMLFIPRLPADYAVWMGKLKTTEEVKAATGVDAVHYTDEMIATLKNRSVHEIHVLNGVNNDSGLTVLSAAEQLHKMATAAKEETTFTVDGTSTLFDILNEQRVRKTEKERVLLKAINAISSRAHCAVMREARVGLTQHHLESTFLHHCYFTGGCRHVSYLCICATGEDGAVLHHVKNNNPLLDGTLALVDMGGEYHQYISDITCNFPINGVWTSVQTFIYNAVLEAHDAVIAAVKPGVDWKEMHKLSLLTMGRRLREFGLFTAETTDDDLIEHDLMFIFCPHGLGHLMGLDTHDVGGYTPSTPPRSTKLSFKKLRTARILEPHIYISVEPGCYFNHTLLEAAFKDPIQKKFLNETKLRQSEFWHFGGIRVESNVMITETGCDVFTQVPRRTEDISGVMAGTIEWPIHD